MPPNDRTLGERAFETLVKGYRDIRGAENLPADQRVYVESVIDRRRDPLTEKSFKPEELEVMRNVITRKYDALKPKFQQDIANMRNTAASDLQEAYRAKDPETRQSWLGLYRKTAAVLKDLQAY